MKEDLKAAYDWFSHPDGNLISHLSQEGKQKIYEIQTLLPHSVQQAQKISRDLYFDTKENYLEVGEILVRVAIHAMLLNEEKKDATLNFAKEQLQNVVVLYPAHQTHHYAISLWLLGFIYWQFPHLRKIAIEYWQYCLRVLIDLSYSPSSLNPGWYQEILYRVQRSLYFSRMSNQYHSIKFIDQPILPAQNSIQPASGSSVIEPEPVAAVPQLPEGPVSPSSPTKKSPGKPKPSHPIPHKRTPVIPAVPAGGLKAINPNDIEFTYLDNLVFNNQHYTFVSLFDNGDINIQPSKTYLIIHINGDSMNETDIQDGDYVLIQLQNHAQHMDIVLATGITELEEIGTATIKRYHQQNGKIELHPESTNPVHQSIQITKDHPLEILGIAVAVLKIAINDDEDNLHTT